MSRAATLALAAALTAGCASPLQQHAAPGGPYEAMRCATLDDTHRSWGGLAKFAGVLAGAGGIAVVPISDDQKALRLGIGISGVLVGGLAAASVYVSEDAAAAWSRDCAK